MRFLKNILTLGRATAEVPQRPQDRWAEGFSLNIVGESHYQRAIKRCREGEKVELRREPTNKFDPNAVQVISYRDETIGYLSRDRAEWIGKRLNEGADVRAIVQHITGEGRQSRGIVLKVWIKE